MKRKITNMLLNNVKSLVYDSTVSNSKIGFIINQEMSSNIFIISNTIINKFDDILIWTQSEKELYHYMNQFKSNNVLLWDNKDDKIKISFKYSSKKPSGILFFVTRPIDLDIMMLDKIAIRYKVRIICYIPWYLDKYFWKYMKKIGMNEICEKY